MGFASKNLNITIRFIVSRVQHVKECKNYVWLNYRSKIVWAILHQQREEKNMIEIRSKNEQCMVIYFAKKGEKIQHKNTYGKAKKFV